ncbi:MAG: tetraacyldisaccharide 4'-kinase [Acidobacteria bacterium]|nr:tetraacyldisaccharide 4'-kinase [Acidobacteriota bacterium]
MGLEQLLRPFTPLYSGAVRTRAAAYRRGLLPRVRLPRPVISVGNLSFGGTGKTPTVVALVRDLARRGRRPAVLTRGYGRKGSEPLFLLGPDVLAPAERAGDEPLEMASRLPGVPIVVDTDRVRGGRRAIDAGADVLVLDDGFQHLRLERDLDLLLIDAGDPWAGGHLPPRGRLREPLAAMARASAILVTKLGQNLEILETIAATVHRHAPGLPVLGARLQPSRLVGPDGRLPLDSLRGRAVVVFAGVGRPGAFEELLKDLGAEIAAARWFEDHHRFTGREIKRLSRLAARHGAVAVTTAKDAVKLPPGCPAWVLEVEMAPLDGSWDALWAVAPGIAP